MNDLRTYSKELQEVLAGLDVEKIETVIGILQRARLDGRLVFIIGNGGSASTASHFVCDLTKNTRRDGSPLVRAVCLGDNLASLTAYANDEGYERVFSGQLANLVSSDDVLIAISTSGNSKNVLHAVEVAKVHKALTIGFTGADGGQLSRMVDVNLYVPSDRIEYVEDVHLILEHMITARLRESAESDSVLAADINLNLELVENHSMEPVKLDRFPSRPEIPTHQVATNLSEYQGGLLNRTGLLQRMLSLSVSSVQAISGSIVFLNENREPELGFMVHRNHLWETKPADFEEMFQHGLAGWVVENRQPVLVNNTLEDDRWVKREWETQASRSVLCVPVIAEAEVVGVMTLVYPRREFFSEQDLVLAVALATGLSILASRQYQTSRARLEEA